MAIGSHEVMHRILDIEYPKAIRRLLVGHNLHGRHFPVGTVLETQINVRAFWIESGKDGINSDVLTLWNCYVAGLQLDGHLVDWRFQQRVSPEAGNAIRQIESRKVESAQKKQRENTGGECKRRDVTLVDLFTKLNIAGAIQGVLYKKVVEHDLIGSRLVDRFDCADKTVFESRILFLYKPGELFVRRNAAKRHHQCSHHGRDQGSNAGKFQNIEEPEWNLGSAG